jgi:hypothetical protein
MNWASAMVGGVALLATIYYIVWGRKTYTPPNETTEDFIERYEATSVSLEKGGVNSGLAEESVEPEKILEE